jgi:predicted phage terminase large subunit-like protein
VSEPPRVEDLVARGMGATMAARLAGTSREHAQRSKKRPAPATAASTEAQRRGARAHPAMWAALASGGRWVYARHLELLADLVLQLRSGDGPRLHCVSMPPRHGKSLFLSRYLPGYWLGTRPDDRVMLVTYQERLARRWSRSVRDDLAAHGAAVFGVSSEKRASTAEWGLTGAGGRRLEGGLTGLGRGGALTGRGAHLLLCDDLVKGRADVQTAAQRAQLWDWFQAEALTRLEPGAAAIVVMTRWHHDDVVGRIARGDAGPGWRVTNLPALSDGPGDALARPLGAPLWPERWSAAKLATTRANVGAHVWGALYQGQPSPAEGSLFRRAWLRTYDLDAAGEVATVDGRGALAVAGLRRFATVDLAVSSKTSADFTVIAVWGATTDRLLLLDLVRERLEGPDLVPRLRAVARRWALGVLYVERVGFQLAIVQEARRAGLPVREIHPQGDKVARALPATALLEGGTLLLPRGAPWLPALEAELLEFPNGQHDDQVDAIAHGAACWRREVSGGGDLAGFAAGTELGGGAHPRVEGLGSWSPDAGGDASGWGV